MGEVLIKPYELSIWDNELTNTEQKIAVIGSHLLKTPNMAYDIVFTKNIKSFENKRNARRVRNG